MNQYSDSQNYSAGRSGNDLRADTYSSAYQAGVRERENERYWNQMMVDSAWADYDRIRSCAPQAAPSEPVGFSRGIIGLIIVGWFLFSLYLSLFELATSGDWGTAVASFLVMGIAPIIVVKRICRVALVERALDAVDAFVAKLFRIALIIGFLLLLGFLLLP